MKVGGWVEARDKVVWVYVLKQEGTWWDSDSVGGRKASVEIPTFLGALAPLGAGRQVCNKQVLIQELDLGGYDVFFSHDECGCRAILFCILPVQGVRKSGSKQGRVCKLGVRMPLSG